ncbi:MAG TPA: hypothetical protein VGV39_20960 [Mesorhizobium sp.]|jgi:hypothetical protein|uniref:hypothetical protein n=1 Tax=Mesorhizobium sp. TaxID=1871066 RepID=UPI002DDCC6A1|nr:hypothetical protein [Mesorhizobium sp.]HEV2505560.1 hypothetical protein [Mesorhizobium sp.]
MIELTEKEQRFLKRVHKVTHFPWTNKVKAVDSNGKAMRLSRAMFERLRDDGILIRSSSHVTSNTYKPINAPVTPEVEEVLSDI